MDIKEAKKRYKAAFSNQADWRDLLEDAFFYNIPERNNFTLRSQGDEENNQIFDDTASSSLPKFANRMQRSLFPEAEEWVQFKAGVDIPDAERQEIDGGLEDYTKTFFSFLNATNFYTEINPSFIDCGVSTGVIQLEETPITDDGIGMWVNIPLNEIAFEQPKNGLLEDSWRKFKKQGGAIKDKWPKANIPEKLQQMIKKDPDKEVDLIQGHTREKNKFHVRVIWDNHILFEEQFNTARIIPFRLNVYPRETFGRGPGILVLPTIRDLNTMQQLILENAALNVAGMYTARSDTVFNPYTFTVTAGGVIPVKSNDNANPTLRRMENSGDLGMGQLIVNDMRDVIRKAYFVDPMGDISDPVRSATEQTMRMQEFLKDQGASISRLRTELVERVVTSYVDLLTSRGKLPKEIKVDGKTVKIQHNTQLVRAEKQDDYNALITLLSSVAGSLGPEAMLATLKVEDIPEGMADMLGVSSDFVRGKPERTKLIQGVMGAINGQQGNEPVGEEPAGGQGVQ